MARLASHRALVRALRARDAAAAEAIMISDASGGLHDLLETSDPGATEPAVPVRR